MLITTGFTWGNHPCGPTQNLKYQKHENEEICFDVSWEISRKRLISHETSKLDYSSSSFCHIISYRFTELQKGEPTFVNHITELRIT